MKVLVVSLLRLGDGIMASPVIAKIKAQYPNAEIHMLMNRECESLRELIPDINKFHFFDRKNIQSSLGEATRSVFEAYDRVKELSQKLSDLNFDLVINLTQNKLSGYLMKTIVAKEKIGLSLSPNGWVSFGSSWFRYLNAFSGEDYDGSFHFTDICLNSIEGPSKPYGYNLNNVNRFKFEKQTDGPVIFIQAFTSDKKKNWNVKSWTDAIVEFKRLYNTFDLRILAAPAEVEEAELIKQNLLEYEISVSVLSLNLADTFTALNHADILVSLDTSIKHIAAAARCKVLEIALGSSDVAFTGVYKSESLVLRAKLPCSPCPHSSKCQQESHLCGDAMDPKVVGACIGYLLNSDWISIKTLANEYSNQLQFLRTHSLTDGVWYPEDLTCNESSTVSQLLSIAAWKMVINGEHLNQISKLGSATLQFNRNLAKLNINIVAEEKHIKCLQEQDLGFLKAQEALSKLVAKYEGGDVDWQGVLSELSFNKSIQNHFKKMCKDFEGMAVFGLRQIQSHLNLWSAQTQVQIKILKASKETQPEVLV